MQKLGLNRGLPFCKRLAAGLFLLVSNSSFGFDLSATLARAEKENWAQDIQWQRLLQYQKNIFGEPRSQTDDKKFFLDPDGQKNPALELRATLKSLSENTRVITSRDGKNQDPVACVFPARRMWLQKKIAEKSADKFADVNCERYSRFKEILRAESLTYVFSSYYLNNPASSFGHTFLRLNKAPSSRDGERYELADYGVSYAALKVSENPIVYSFLGVSGLMPGAFEVNPYYFKVREYNDFESRDLWEYDLDFSREEVAMVVAFIWELSDVNFNYHYFSENCSYRMLAILDVARPSLHLIDDLKAQVMPADTVQTVYRSPGLVSKIHYRPSGRATFLSRYESLSKSSKNEIRQFAQDESVVKLQNDKEVLDAAMDYLDFRYPTEILKKTGKYSLKKEVLEKRAEVGGISQPLSVIPPWSESPHEAEGSRRMGVGYRHWQNDGEAAVVNYKFALHDLLDPKIGYPPGAQITMGDFALSYKRQTSEVAIDKAILFEVVSLSPVSTFVKLPSWRLKVSHERSYENDCAGLCHYTEFSGGIGETLEVGSFDIGAWLRATGETSSSFQTRHWRIGAGPSLMLRWNQDWFSLLAETYYRYDTQTPESEFRQSSFGAQVSPTKEMAVRAEVIEQNERTELSANLFYYY